MTEHTASSARTQRRCRPILVHFLVALCAGGCATQTLQSTLPKITASLPKLNDAPGEPSRIDADTQAVYARIAGGAKRCWFAPTGQLKSSHIFHADLEPPAKGGAAEISILERDLTGGKTWGTRTFKVVLTASAEQTVIEVENLKMAEPTVSLMRADVFHWAQGGVECTLKPIEVAAPVAAAPVKKQKVKGAQPKPAP
jgi:hypothetical protein